MTIVMTLWHNNLVYLP